MIKNLFSLLLILISSFVPSKAQYLNNLSENFSKESSPGSYKEGNYLVEKDNSSAFLKNGLDFQRLSSIINSGVIYPYVTSENRSLCIQPLVTLQANPVNSSYSYQWYKYVSPAYDFVPIDGAIQTTYKASELGSYKVMINDGINGPRFSSAFRVDKVAEAKLLTLDDRQNVEIQAQANAPLQFKISFSNSVAPHHFRYIENNIYTNNSFSISTTENPYILTVSPQQNTKYSLTNVTSTCNSGETGGYNSDGNEIVVIVDESTGFAFETPEKLNVCAGETIKIPYREVGTWSGQKAIELSSYSINGRHLSDDRYLFANPMEYTVPEDMNVGESIRLYVKVKSPYMKSNTISSPYFLTVTDVGCKSRATVRSDIGGLACEAVTLYSSPYYNGNMYQWYKDGEPAKYGNQSFMYAQEPGNYQVHIKNDFTGYESWSDPDYYVNVRSEKVPILSNNTVICEEGVPVNLQAAISGKAYRWEVYDTKTRKFIGLAGEYGKELATKTVGSYRVWVTTDYCTLVSEIAEVTYEPKVRLTNALNTEEAVEVQLGQEVTLRVHVDGLLPFNVWLSDSKQRIVKRVTVNSSTYDIKITPGRNETYWVNGANSCGKAVKYNSLQVKVNPPPSLSFNAISSTSFCKGNLIKIPYTNIGAWDFDKAISVSLMRNNTVLENSTMRFIPSPDTLGYYLNTDVPDGNYKLRVGFTTSSTEEIYESPYEISVSNCGNFKPYISITSNSTCNSGYDLSIFPKGRYQYSWYVNGRLQNWGVSSATVTDKARYMIRVVDTETGYSSDTDPVDLVINRSENNNTGVNSELCNNINVRLSASREGDSYQWYYAEMGEAYVEIPGATNRIFFTTHVGKHMVIVKMGQCEYIQSFKCPINLDFVSATVCQGGAFSVPIDAARTVLTSLKLIDEASGEEVADLGKILYNDTHKYVFGLPKTIGPGKYKLKAVFGGLHSVISKGILTVSSQMAEPKPVITVTPATSIQHSLDVTGCSENLVWDHVNYEGQNLYILPPNATSIYRVFCTNYLGCSSEMAELIIEKNCNDVYEPNDTHLQAKEIKGDVFTTGNLCFDWSLDEDWFFTYVNGRKYYVVAKKFYTYQSNRTTGVYHLKKEYRNNVLSFEFLNPGYSYDLETTFLVLYDENLNELANNIDSKNRVGLASKVSIKLENPCGTNTILSSDFKENESNVIRAHTIRGRIKVENSAKVGLEASKNILLEPGFETKINSQGVFTAQIKRCD